METSKAMAQGYMTVGEVAKKMDVTVRTLQYYDREGRIALHEQIRQLKMPVKRLF